MTVKLVKPNWNGKGVRKRKDFLLVCIWKTLGFFYPFYIKGVLALRNHCVLEIIVLGLRVNLGIMEDGHGSSDQIPRFLKNTYEMVEDSSTNSIVS